MRLQDYERANDVRGIHGVATTHANFDRGWWINELKQMRMSWYKLIDDGSGSVFDFARELRQNGIMPIIRMYQNAPLPNRLPQRALDTIARYVNEGVTKWFEILNEPNLPLEWGPGQWDAHEGRRKRVMVEVWLADAEEVIRRGGYPAFPCMAQSGRTPLLGSIPWYEQSFDVMAKQFYGRTKAVFERGGWIAVHDAVLNHFYRDQAGVWHFECPYDVLTQAKYPGIDVFDGDNSLMGHRVPVQLLAKHFNLIVPVLSTEGGVFTPPHGWAQWDASYPGFDYHGHADGTVAMYRWLERYRVTYPFYFAMCPWLIANKRMNHFEPAWREDGFYHDRLGPLPVVGAIKAMGAPLENPEALPPIGIPLPVGVTIRLGLRADWLDPKSPFVGKKTLLLEEYLRDVVHRELNAANPMEALKAQAVAARTYAYRAMKNPRHKDQGVDICNTTCCQVYLEGSRKSRTDRAIRETSGLIVKYRGKVIGAFYSSDCGGRTENSEDVWVAALPYCRSVDCPKKDEPRLGHGVGMCQKGAVYMAREGRNHREILHHYYTGITLGPISSVPDPPPPPDPPEPEPEPIPSEGERLVVVERTTGSPIIVGNIGRPGLIATFFGNVAQPTPKSEYGPDGVEFMGWPRKDLTINIEDPAKGKVHPIEVKRSHPRTIVAWEQVQPSPTTSSTTTITLPPGTTTSTTTTILPSDGFPIPRFGFGMHDGLDYREPQIAADIERMHELGARGVLTVPGDELQMEKAAVRYRDAGLQVIVRPYTLIDRRLNFARYTRILLDLGFPGVIQIYNEPGDDREWEDGRPDIPLFVRKWCDQAEGVIAAGGWAGLQVLDVNVLRMVIAELRTMGLEELWDKTWFCTHDYGLNHPLIYPYDPVNQEGIPVQHPGWEFASSIEEVNRWRVEGKNPGQTIHEDNNCILGFLAFAKVFQEEIGFVPPMIMGEGGWQYGSMQDRRYPRVLDELHAKYHTRFLRIFKDGKLPTGDPLPSYLIGVCFWILSGPDGDAWYSRTLGLRHQTIEMVRSEWR